MEPTILTVALMLKALAVCGVFTLILNLISSFLLKQDEGMCASLTGFMVGAFGAMIMTDDLLAIGIACVVCLVQGILTAMIVKAIKNHIGFPGLLEDPKPCTRCGRC